MEPFIGMIVQFGGNFAPRGWALCDGQLLSINSHSALFSILGTTYGGDGVSTFGLPDLRGRLGMHAGTGPGLTPRSLGTKSGHETTTLTTNNLPSHSHTVNADNSQSRASTPNGEYLAAGNSYSDAAPNTTMNAGMIGNTGGGQAFDNMPPFQVVNWIIALEGVYPSRS